MTRRLHELRAPEVGSALGPNSVLVQPVGAIEQHGPHLPLSTDLVIASEVAERVVEARGDELDLWLLPPLAYSKSDEHHWAPGTERTVDSTAAAAYHQRVLDSATWGGLFVAHHYTRYLGDLSGGQAIGRILDRAFGLDGAGVAFYDFPAIPKPKPYKDAYRAALDSIAPTAEEQTRIVEEVKVAFGLNQALFEELDIALCLRARRPQAPRR